MTWKESKPVKATDVPIVQRHMAVLRRLREMVVAQLEAERTKDGNRNK